MRKAFACAFVLFMFASTTTALAGNKRFCGFIAPNEGKNGQTPEVIQTLDKPPVTLMPKC